MGAKSNIEWTDASWTPIRARNVKTGKIGWHCEHCTTGCINCYAEGMNLRLGTGLPFKPGHRDEIEIFLDLKMLQVPFHWKKLRMVFVCSMTDLFADFVKDEWIDKIFAVMALCPQHTFQVLTKRAERMRDYFLAADLIERVARAIINCEHGPRDALHSIVQWNIDSETLKAGAEAEIREGYPATLRPWPLPNVWLGVSCERQQEADERIPLLLATPAAIRFISAEPLLGPIDLSSLVYEGGEKIVCALTGERGFKDVHCWENSGVGKKLDWIIVGGESGTEARPMQIEWATDIVQQCMAADTACFIKQLGDAAQSDGYPYKVKKAKGGDPDEWPDVLQVRQMPTVERDSQAARIHQE